MPLTWDAATSAPRFDAYAWDQSDRFVSVYVDFASSPEPAVETLFEKRRFAVVVGGKAIVCAQTCKAILPAKCKVKLKASRFVVKLRKETAAETWSGLTDELDVKEAARKMRVATRLKDASTQELLADMYANASDEERKGLREAAATGQKKREK
jgi:hypothetical protein